MINVMKQSNGTQAYLNEYVADAEEDIKDLPTNIHPGSVCIVAETANVYILNNKKEWILL